MLAGGVPTSSGVPYPLARREWWVLIVLPMQWARMRMAFRDAGPEAVAGFRQVLEAMMDPEMRHTYTRLKDSGS